MDRSRRSFPAAGGWFFRHVASFGQNAPSSPLVPSPLAALRERAQWCVHELDWVRGFFQTSTPHPSSRVAAPGCPLPQGERATIAATALVGPPALVIPTHDVEQPISFPRRVCVRVLQLCFTHRGGWSADRRSGASAAPVWACCRARQALARRLASHNAGRSPLGAPPWRFFTRGRASISGIASGSVERAPRGRVVVPGGRGPGPPGARGCELPAAGRHSPLRLQDRRRILLARLRVVEHCSQSVASVLGSSVTSIWPPRAPPRR